MVQKTSHNLVKTERYTRVHNSRRSRELLGRLTEDWRTLTTLLEDSRTSRTHARTLLNELIDLGLVTKTKNKFKQRRLPEYLFKLTAEGVVFKARCFK